VVTLCLSLVLASTSLFALDRWVRRNDRPAAVAFVGARSGDGVGLPARLWRLPAFRGLAQDGRPIDARALRGRVWVADFIYTQCTSACPMLTARMMLLARKLHPSIGLLSFSVDPAHDTSAALSAYAGRWPALGRPWTLVSMSAEAVDELATGMNVAVGKPEDGDGEILHATLFFLIDRDGWVRGAYRSHKDEDLASLARDAATLGAASPVPPGMDADASLASSGGARLFVELGCAGCHADARVAPPLGGSPGRQVALEGGGRIALSRAYLRESILNPASQLVRGYPPTMPSYRDVITDRQVEELVSYLAALPASPAAPTGAGDGAITAADPVCHMRVVVTDQTPRSERSGTVHYFCSESCRDRFASRPASIPSSVLPRAPIGSSRDQGGHGDAPLLRKPRK